MGTQVDSMEDRIWEARIRTLYSNGSFALLYVFLISSPVVLMLWDMVNHVHLLIWFALVVLSATVRSILTYKFIRGENFSSIELKRWARWFVYGTLSSGLIWSSLVWFFVDFSATADSFTIVLILIAMLAGALASHALYPPAYYAYLFPVGISLIVELLNEGGKYSYIAFMMVVFVGAFFGYARIHCRLFTNSLRQRFENLDLLENLRVQKDKAEKANVDKTKFLAAASHDLRQPMHAMNLFAESLGYELNSDNQKSLLRKLRHSMSAMGGLLDTLLDMSKLDAGLVKVNIEAVSINTVFSDLEEGFKGVAAEKGLRLDIQYPKEDSFVLSDRILLRNILNNLLSNAIKYTMDGEVKVFCSRQGKKCVLIVKDTGVGISENEQEHVFQAFYQVGNPARDRSQGIGLGLSIVSRLCDLMEHHCSFKSASGVGTTFSVLMPCAIQKQPNKQVHFHPVLNKLDISVLVIDDESDILDGMCDMLSAWGCLVLTATSIPKMEELLQNQPHIDFIIADYRLPNETVGTDAIIRAKQLLNLPNLPSVIISGDTEPVRMQEVKEAGFTMLHKPVRPAQMRSVIQRLIRQ